jgi:hypothetical protein
MMVCNEEPKIIGLSTDTTPKNPVRRSATKQEKSNINHEGHEEPSAAKAATKIERRLHHEGREGHEGRN